MINSDLIAIKFARRRRSPHSKAAIEERREERERQRQEKEQERERAEELRRQEYAARTKTRDPVSLCPVCYGLPHRRNRPTCRKCGEPWQPVDTVTIEEIMKRAVDYE